MSASTKTSENIPAGAPFALNDGCPSPLFVYDWPTIEGQLDLFRRLMTSVDGTLLYSVKALPFLSILHRMAPFVDGFSVSSLFEAKLAREATGLPASIHLTSPGLRLEHMEQLASLCSHINFNSLEQLQRLSPLVFGRAQIGLRINHGISSIADVRYDPCREVSKLGVPLEDLAEFIKVKPTIVAQIQGLHFHSHFQQKDSAPLAMAFERIANVLGPQLSQLEWINLGGGYAPTHAAEVEALQVTLESFHRQFKGLLILEPGNAIVGHAGSLSTQVIDLFDREGKRVAILDTGVHHLPEVFEYQRCPHLKEADPEGGHQVLLAGSSCLAGDLFGYFTFNEPLAIGDRLTFVNVGSYSMVKASRFNGHDLPGLAIRDASGQLVDLKHFGYGEFRRQWAG